MLKVNDCCWAAGTDPENKYVSKIRRKAKPALQQNPRKAKKGPLSIRIKRGSERDVRTCSVGGFRVILTLQ